MAFRPNYRIERRERDLLKQAKREEKQRRRQERKEQRDPPEPPASEGTAPQKS